MDNPASDIASASAEWVAKSTRARALAEALEEKVCARPEDRLYLLELARKLRVGASILERRVLRAQLEEGSPSSLAASETPTDDPP